MRVVAKFNRSVLFVVFVSSHAMAAPQAEAAIAPAPADATPVSVQVEPRPASPAGQGVDVAPVTDVTPPIALTPPPASPPVAPAPPEGPACAASALACLKTEHVAVWPRARLRVGYEFVTPDSQLLYVGHNDGFYLDQARIGVEANVKNLLALNLTVETTSLMVGAVPNQPVTPILSALRDAYVAFTPSPWLRVQAGQQVMPSDLEGGDIDQTLPFTRRSVLSRGVRAGHGIAVGGLSPDRQVGIVVGNGQGAALGPVPLTYKLGISNGNGQNLFGNDNKYPALYGRVGAGYESSPNGPAEGKQSIKVGLGGRYDPRTVGELPNQYEETDIAGFADVVAEAFGFQLVMVGIARHTSFTTLVPDLSDSGASDVGMGASAWLSAKDPFGFSTHGVRPGYRISYYDPSSAFTTDQLLENTVGVRWDVPFWNLPLSIFADATFLTELGSRDLQNNRFTLLVQTDL